MTKIKEGYKEMEIGVIPEGWEVYPIDEISEFISNGFVGTASPFYSDNENDAFYLMGNNVRENYIDTKTVVRINREFTEKNQKAKIYEGDMLTVQSGHIGTSCIVTREFDSSYCHAVIITRFIKDKIMSNFQAYYLNSVEGKNRLKGIFVGTTIKHINTKDLKRFVVPVPPLLEQSRIAEILSTADAHIDKLDKIIDDYQLLKKGMMKKLLTEGIGHTEFKETEIGRIPKEWEISTLEGCCEKITDGSHSSPTPIDESSYYIATVAHMTNGGFAKDSLTKISKDDFKRLDKNGCKPMNNDVLLSKDGTIGKVLLFNQQSDNIVLLSSITIIRAKKNLLLPSYLEQILKMENTLIRLTNMKKGSAIRRIILRDIKSLLIPIPPLDEQAVIAEMLREADKKLYTLNFEKEDFHQLKKALMEKLLTGKIRVNNLEA